jgi:hypothetical protein
LHYILVEEETLGQIFVGAMVTQSRSWWDGLGDEWFVVGERSPHINQVRENASAADASSSFALLTKAVSAP